jgi:hypothetical protein
MDNFGGRPGPREEKKSRSIVTKPKAILIYVASDTLIGLG